MTIKKPTAFVSYAHADSLFVDELVRKLKAHGVNVWIDKWEVRVGDSIVEKINHGIGAADYLLIVISQASVKSRWVAEELNAGIIKNVEDSKGAFILPVLIERVELPPLLKHRRYADFVNEPDRALKDLLAAMNRWDVDGELLEVLLRYYETGCFKDGNYYARSPQSLLKHDEERLKDLAAAGFIRFRVYYDNGQWGYEITELGCDVLKRKFGIDVSPAPYGYNRNDRKQYSS